MEDEKIIDLFWARSETAIAETAAKYGGYCRSIAYRILGSSGDAEECENDTYGAAWRAMPPARPGILRVFLGRLTRNIALDRYDYNRAQKRRGEFDVLLSELSECLAARESTESEFEAGHVAKLISAFLRSVDEDSRAVFIRRYWYADSIADISKRYVMSGSKVKSMLFRMRKKLADYLKQEGVEL